MAELKGHADPDALIWMNEPQDEAPVWTFYRPAADAILAMIPSDRDDETERGIRIGLAIDYCRIASKAADPSTAQAIALAALDVLSLPVAELEPDTAAAFGNASPTPGPQPGDT